MNEITLPIHKIECFQHFNFQNATRFLYTFNFFYPVIRGIGCDAHFLFDITEPLPVNLLLYARSVLSQDMHVKRKIIYYYNQCTFIITFPLTIDEIISIIGEIIGEDYAKSYVVSVPTLSFVLTIYLHL